MSIVSRILDPGVLTKAFVSSDSNLNLPPRDRLSLLASAAVIWEAVLNAIAPLGYEDEQGFHYGLPPVQRNWRDRADQR